MNPNKSHKINYKKISKRKKGKKIQRRSFKKVNNNLSVQYAGMFHDLKDDKSYIITCDPNSFLLVDRMSNRRHLQKKQ